jgi:hypothetical protein
MMGLSVQFHKFNGYSPDGIFGRDTGEEKKAHSEDELLYGKVHVNRF